jgi:hypothetical protein
VAVYTAAQIALWDTLAEFVRQHPATDVLDALSDAFLLNEESGAEAKRMESIGRALERVRAAHASEVAP